MSGFNNKPTRPASKPLFAGVAQPRYAWDERETNVLLGATALPKATANKGTPATITVPRSDVPDEAQPDVRAVRLHEMLHARFTPDVQPVLESQRTTSGRMSGTAAQIAEDVRLSYIAARNDITPDDTYFSASTLKGCVSALLGARESAKALSEASTQSGERDESTRNFDVGVVSVLGSMHGHKIEGIPSTFDLDVILDTLRKTAEADFGTPGLDAFDDAMRLGARGVAATRSIFDTAKEIYGGATPSDMDALTAAQRTKRIRSDFLKLYSHVSESLERLLVEEEVEEPPPSLKMPGENGKPQEGKGDNPGEQPGGGSSSDPNKESEPKKQDQKNSDGGAENGADSEGGDDGSNGEEDKTPDEGGKKERIAANKKASSEVENARIRSGASTLQEESVKTVRMAIRRAEEQDKRHPPMRGAPPMVARPAAGGAITDNDENILVKEMDIDISLTTDPNVMWTTMKIVRPALVRAFKARVPRRGRPSIDGEIPRHFSRWFSDKAILDSRGRRPGGTLLLDISGSMSWSHAQTMALIEAVPAMTIAAYSSGTDHAEFTPSGSNLHMGRLTILAHQGRAVASDDPWQKFHGGGNGCDGPALAWLARQPGPRVWFSDGGVTGWDGYTSEPTTMEHIIECTRLMAIGGVWRTTSPKDVVRIFGGQEPKDKDKTSRDISTIRSWAFDPAHRTSQYGQYARASPFVRHALRGVTGM